MAPTQARSLAVYCASSPGVDPRYAQAAAQFGALLAARGIRLVYGGGHVGLMGSLADGALENGGEVVGVITEALEAKEVAHRGVSSLHVVRTMHERKARMADLSDGFVMLPGGFGTLDEFFEAVTWTQLGVHAKPCGVLDVAGYFGSLRAFIDRAVHDRFVREEHFELLVVEDSPELLLDRLATWRPVLIDKWMDRESR